jgi:tetratricopeptide (TPR) repeat protein
MTVVLDTRAFLTDVEGRPTQAARRNGLATLLDALQNPGGRTATRPDATTRHRIRDLAGRLGWSVGSFEDLPMRAGETYLLLAQPLGAATTLQVAVSPAGSLVDAVDARIDERTALSRARDAWQPTLLARGRAIPWDRGFSLSLSPLPGLGRVQGRSLEAAVALALLSAASGRPLPHDLAVTAELRAGPNGWTLQPVTGIGQKLRAAVEAFPEIRRVLVAQDQTVDEAFAESLDLLRCPSLEDAARVAGLLDEPSLECLPRPTLQEIMHAADRAVMAVEKSGDGWRRRCDECSRLAGVCDGIDADDLRTTAVTLRGHALLFAIHACDDERIRAAEEALERAIPDRDSAAESQLPAAVQAWVAIVRTTRAIDGEEASDALPLAERAVDLAERVADHDLRHLRGRALGTRGRARLHAGRAEEALADLRDALAHHRKFLPREAPRSATYLAQALRLAGRPAEALGVLAEARDLLRQQAIALHAESPLTHLFLDLEEGRCHLARGDLARARTLLQSVEAAQPAPTDYPRLGAARSLLECAARARDEAETRARARAMFALLRDAGAAEPDRDLAAVALFRARLVAPETWFGDVDWDAVAGQLTRETFGRDPARMAAAYVD